MTRLLNDLSAGRSEALNDLLPLVYQELHRRARGYLKRERPGHTLQPTALVNEAYLRLVDQRHVQWQDRAHFFAIAAQIMRRILVDHARAQGRAKRGGARKCQPLEEATAAAPERSIDVLALDQALTRLETVDPLQSRIVSLRYFAGLTADETADILGISPATLRREWAVARAWLFASMNASGAAAP